MEFESSSIQTARRQVYVRKHPLDGLALCMLIEAGLTWLKVNQQVVNALNVFPVPDGDTGINMVLTLQAAFDEIEGSQEKNFGKVAHSIAHGALMGARGNSGVILSQLWRGFARGVDNYEELDGISLANAFAAARDTAYKGVVRPVEGTILTVAKDIASEAEAALQDTDDPIAILERVVKAADLSVQRTPELLAELKKAGVVDAGGKGLFFILEGMLRLINGLPLDAAVTTVQPLAAMNLEDTLETIEPGQDWEVVVDFRPNHQLDLERFYADLQRLGTSIQVGEGEGFYRMHIHVPSEKQYQPVEYTKSLGTVTKVSMENLIYQMDELGQAARGRELRCTPVEPGQIAVVAVSPGDGISRVFASLGVAAIVEGGQTMNPSTQDILAAFENLPTDRIIILPNNKNIILAAQAAIEVSPKQAAVVPSTTVPEGLAAMLRLVPEGDFDEVIEEMNAALQEVQTGEITTAVRDAEIDGVKVKEGQIIALYNRQLVCAAATLEEACLCLLDKAGASSYELVTLFFGENVTQHQAGHLGETIRAAYPNLEVEIQEGGQPHYQYILSIE